MSSSSPALAVSSILTVCLGNICRSPAAESILIRVFADAGIDSDQVSITSAGTADYHIGSRPHEYTRAVGAERGYSFDSVGIQLTRDMLESTDLILAMDHSNVHNILSLLGPEDQHLAEKVILIGAFASDVESGSDVRIVADPYGYPTEVFERMYDQLEDCAAGVLAAVQDPSRFADIMGRFNATQLSR